MWVQPFLGSTALCTGTSLGLTVFLIVLPAIRHDTRVIPGLPTCVRVYGGTRRPYQVGNFGRGVVFASSRRDKEQLSLLVNSIPGTGLTR